MKQIILFLLASIWLHSASATTTVRKDPSNGLSYVNVTGDTVPLWLSYGMNVTNVKRLYIVLNDNLYDRATFTFSVAGEVVIDSVTRNYPVLKTGAFALSDSAYAAWNANDNRVPFEIIAPSLGLTIVD